MKHVLFLLVFSSMLSCSDTRNKQTTTFEKTIEKKWYEGGTLHRSKIHEWKMATEDNKLATCGDFMAKTDNTVSMDILYKRAIELRACINEATRGLEKVNDSDVAVIASLCATTLGYQ